MLNRFTVTGRLCADPELRNTTSNIAFCSFRVACTRDYKREGEEKPETDFFSATAWRGTAEFIAKNFSKGRVITLDGRMESRIWTEKDSDKNRTSYEINVEHAYFGDSKPAAAPTPGSLPGETTSGIPIPTGQVPDDFSPIF